MRIAIGRKIDTKTGGRSWQVAMMRSRGAGLIRRFADIAMGNAPGLPIDPRSLPSERIGAGRRDHAARAAGPRRGRRARFRVLMSAAIMQI